MRDVVQKMVEAEAEAKRILAQAQAEADRILAEARAKAQEIAGHHREELREQTTQIAEKAIQAAEAERRERLARAATKIEAEVRLDDAVRKEAVNAVIRTVAGNL